MRECLRIVPQRLIVARIDLFGEEAESASTLKSTLKDRHGFGQTTLQGQVIDKPERTHQKGSFFPGKAIVAMIAINEAMLIRQLFQNTLDGCVHAWIIGSDKANQGQEKARCVQSACVVRLGKGSGL